MKKCVGSFDYVTLRVHRSKLPDDICFIVIIELNGFLLNYDKQIFIDLDEIPDLDSFIW